MIRAGVIGGAGYAGGEAVRLLLNHPEVELAFVQSRSQAGLPVAAVHRDLEGETDLVFTDIPDGSVEVWLICMGHGEAKNWLPTQEYRPGLKIVDLSHDFRAGGNWGTAPFCYGLPELHRDTIRQSQCIANPGCFATALQLALLPLAGAGQLDTAHITGITGATGAGQSLSPTTHFPWRHANISAYKTLIHQHLAEVTMSLKKAGATEPILHFVPWRGDFPRGIFVSATVPSSYSQEEILELYRQYYSSHPFVVISAKMIDLKTVVNTNKCLIFPEKVGTQLVIHAAIDNLLKGAAGQAVQNMNLMFGFPEDAGLKLKASVY